MIKKITKRISITLLSLILLIYAVLAGYLWISERTLKTELVDTKSIYSRLKIPHQLTLLNDGIASLAKRIEVIEKAQKSIELEFFIYELDLASKVITSKLIEAAKRGVKVKILVDFSATVFKLRPTYAKYLSQFGIEVRYYNTAHNARLVSIQHRSHRKFLIVDDLYAITGGRNIGDDYFNLSSHYNFLDSDVLIEGLIVSDIKESFNTYWNSPLTSVPEIKDAGNEGEILFSNQIEVQKILTQLKVKEKEIAESSFSAECSDISFVTDLPGVLISNRQVYLRLVDFLKEAKAQVVAESPYFILRGDGIDLLEGLSTNGVSVKLLTNSLHSTDAYYTVSAMSTTLHRLNSLPLTLATYNGNAPLNGSILLDEEHRKARWGVHSKRAVIDGKHTIIGTYNIDPRSANFNSEVVIICRDSEQLAQKTLADMETRFANSWPLIEKNESHYFTLFKDANLLSKLNFLLALPLAKLFDFLL
jgi:cardiolipin synthase C